MGWLSSTITFGWNYVQAIVQCGVEHSAQIVIVGTDLVKCATTKLFGG